MVADLDVAKLPRRRVPKLRQRIGCVFQDFRLLPNQTVAENVAFALEVIGKPRQTVRRVVPEVLELVGLDGKEHRLPHELSGGEQQRVAVARAFVNRPLILLADEPTGNLDPDTSQDIMRLLDRINRTGTTVLMATHDHTIVDPMRRRVVELEQGKLVRDQPAASTGSVAVASSADRDDFPDRKERTLRCVPDFVCPEVVTGLRRNVTMTVAMILTMAISLACRRRPARRAHDRPHEQLYSDHVEVQVALTADISADDADCSAAPSAPGSSRRWRTPRWWRRCVYESQEQAYERFQELFKGQSDWPRWCARSRCPRRCG